MRNGRGWGADATFRPGWAQVRQAAYDAVTAPEVWVPVLGAGLLHVSDADEDISEWAVDETPLFGSNKDADDASDILVYVGYGLFLTSALTAPSGDEPKQWLWSKTKGLAVGFATMTIGSNIVSGVKDATGRERPNETDDESFPSGHTTSASIRYTLAYKNFGAREMPDSARMAMRAGAAGMTLLTGWARVEAAEHYPTDVLFGMALGHFIGSFMTDAFLRLKEEEDLSVALSPADGGLQFSLLARF